MAPHDEREARKTPLLSGSWYEDHGWPKPNTFRDGDEDSLMQHLYEVETAIRTTGDNFELMTKDEKATFKYELDDVEQHRKTLREHVLNNWSGGLSSKMNDSFRTTKDVIQDIKMKVFPWTRRVKDEDT